MRLPLDHRVFRLARAALLALVAAACGTVPVDDQRNDKRLFPARGVIRGTVTYVGPRPCSRGGHVVGNVVILASDRRNPPPPDGLASSAVNFVAVPGDVLFANEPRSVGPELSCPPEDEIVTASAPFTVAPLDAGSYRVTAFYDRRGRFWPTFEFRNQPEAGDIAGGYIDIEEARRNAGDPGYRPTYLPVDVGTQVGATPGLVPDFVIGDSGYVADNVTVFVAARVPFTRPYFFPRGAEDVSTARTSDANPTGDPYAVPVVAMTQDAPTLAPPGAPTPETLGAYQDSLRAFELAWGVAEPEMAAATDRAGPFDLQLFPPPPTGLGGLLVFARGRPIPELAMAPDLWPQVAFVKLVDDPLRRADPQSLIAQGSPEETSITGKAPGPIVVLQGITLLDGSLEKTITGPVPSAPDTSALREQVTVLVRPAALCFDPRRVDAGAVLVTPHLTAQSADANEGERPLFDEGVLATRPEIREVRRGCLPKGRYAISLVYPTGQSWTVPNEAGACAPSEGRIVGEGGAARCSDKPRAVLLSQGARAVLEIVAPATAEGDQTCAESAVPVECLTP